MDANQTLMQRIKTEWGPMIETAVTSSAIPAPFIAALIANETGGNPSLKRYEKSVLGEMWPVFMGNKENFGSIPSAKIVDYVARQCSPMWFYNLDDLCNSHGLTQVMGYQILDPSLVTPAAADTKTLAEPAWTMRYTVALLEQFAKRFQFDERSAFEAMFRCWNGGHPTAQTFDPNYVAYGLVRMHLYEALP